jgi:hypothetical protein
LRLVIKIVKIRSGALQAQVYGIDQDGPEVAETDVVMDGLH